MATYVNKTDKKPSRIAIPEGYESNDEFLNEMREQYDAGVSFDQYNIEAGREDAKFVAGNQWDDWVEQKRRDMNKPVLTFNYLVAFVAQLVGNKLLNETEIRVFPDKGGTKEIASIREGIMRFIYKNSQADLARDEAQKYQVIGGRGVFCLVAEYNDNDVFAQDLKLKQVQDPYSVVADPMSIDPTWADAQWIFVSEDVTAKDFKRRWPKAAPVDFGLNARTWDKQGYWMQEDTVRIVNYWRMVTDGTKVLALMEDGTQQDITDIPDDQWALLPIAFNERTGEPYVREVPNTFAQLYICSGNQILEGPYNYPCSSIPVFAVVGWQINDGERNNRFGLIRWMKDPIRLSNYFRSVQAEALVGQARNKWMTDPNAIKGYEKQWRESPTSDDPFLPYHSDVGKPEMVQPQPIDQGLMAQLEMLRNDLREITNMHEASFGQKSNEVSGRALQQRQNMSDLGSMIYLDRQRLADERCAKLINELIPHFYDSRRIVTIVGPDGKSAQVEINTAKGNQETDVTLGKYGVTVTTGPATATKRQQTLEAMMGFVNAAPESAAMVMDLIAEYQDWPGSDEFARRFRLALPPGVIEDEDIDDQQRMQQEQQAQMAQMAAQMEAAQKEAETAKTVAEAQLAEARAKLSEAQAIKALADAQARLKDVDSKVEDREIKSVAGLLDQHNELIRSDEEFTASREDAMHERMMRSRETSANGDEEQ